MSKISLAASVLLLAVIILHCNAGRTHYYAGSAGNPITYGYNSYHNPYGNNLNEYGVNGYANPGYHGYQDYDGYSDDEYDGDNYGYDSYGGYNGYQYPYGYQKQIVPTQIVTSPVVKEYVAPITKSISTSSLYQTHPTSYGNGYGYAGTYGYEPKYGGSYGSGYYRK